MDSKNVIAAISLSAAVIIFYGLFFAPEPQQISQTQQEENKIIESSDAPKLIDTKKIEPLTSIAETNLKLRKDEIKSKNIREDILKNSPEDNKDFFVVPKVVE